MRTASPILIVDDDPSVLASLELLLGREGWKARLAASPAEALVQTAAAQAAAEPFAAALIDMNFSRATSGEEGLELLAELRRAHPTLPVVLMTAWGSIDLAVRGMKAGAADFLTKPWHPERLLGTLETALELEALRAERAADETAPSRSELDGRYDLAPIVGRAPRLLRVLDLVGRVAPTDAPVLITGESGTGKELLAEAVHRNSKRRGGPFVKVNLGGISSTLFESEMFGHVRGAFTDARERRCGRFELADGGTIFLDEIGETDLAAQVKLLRVLQDRTYEILGSSETQRVDVRIVAATNRDLPKMVAEGSFREDLLYRLNLISVELPPLRARRGDVSELAERLIAAAARDHGRAEGRSELRLTSDARAWLESQSWPGNVRQLKQVLERAVLVGEETEIAAKDLRAFDDLGQRPATAAALPEAGTMTLEEMERAMVEKALRQFAGNMTHAAQALGLSRAALYRRCEKYGLTGEGE